MARKMNKRKNALSNQELNDLDLNEMLDKLLLLQDRNKRTSFVKGTICIVTGICVVIFTLLICASIYKNNFTTESILSMLLAFFSIFISIFFYFKADETSADFYDSSYKFMKDISVTLGKIEERFGEKLNSLNDKITHLDRVSKETSRQIEDKQVDKDGIINELLEKTNLNEEEKERYKRELEKKEEEIENLLIQKNKAEHDARMLRHQMNEGDIEQTKICPGFKVSSKILVYLLNEGKTPSNVSGRVYNELIKHKYIDGNGNVDKDRISDELTDRGYF